MGTPAIRNGWLSVRFGRFRRWLKFPAADAGEVRVWVKTLGHEAADVYLSRDDSIHGNFLVVIRFLDSERSRADFHIMTDKEVKQLRERARSGTILKPEAIRACGQESWDKLENAVQS